MASIQDILKSANPELYDFLSKYGSKKDESPSMSSDDINKLSGPMADKLDEDRDYSGGEDKNPLSKPTDLGEPMDYSKLQEQVQPANVMPSPLKGPKQDIQPSPVSSELLGLVNGPNSSVMPKADPLAEILKAKNVYGPPAPEPVSEKKSASIGIKTSGGSDRPPASIPSAPNEGFTNDTVANALLAQKLASDNQLIANLGRAGATIGTGVAGAISKVEPPKNVSEDFFKDLIKQANAPVKTLEAATEAEKSDPNSTFSVNFRNFAKPLAKEVGINIPDNMSAEQINKLFPQLSNMYTQKEAAKARHDDLMLRMSEMKDRKNERLGLMAETKLSALKQAALRDPRVQRNMQKMDAADRVFSTVGDYNIQSEKDVEKIPLKELNRLPKLMVVELGQELNTLLANSNVTPASTLQKILPKNLNLTTTEWADFVSSKLNPAQQGEFARLVLKTAARQRNQAEKNQEQQMTKYFQGASGLEKYLNDPESLQLAMKGLGVNPDNILKGEKAPQVKKEVSSETFPKTVFNDKTKQKAVVNNQEELDEAKKEGFK